MAQPITQASSDSQLLNLKVPPHSIDAEQSVLGGLLIDNGAFDCDGDGVNDPNIITGAGAVMHGVTLGQVVSDAVSTTNRVTLK